MMGMMGNNPYAMGTMPPGAAGMMRGMGMMPQQPQGPINGMQQAQQAQLMKAQQEQRNPQSYGMGVADLASLGRSMQGMKAQGEQMGKDMVSAAEGGQFQGPMPDGGNLTDTMFNRGQYLQDNPMLGMIRNRFNVWG